MAEQITFGPCSEKQRMVLQDNTTDFILTGGGAGSGKALRHGSKVLTVNGWKLIEELKVGDKVVTPKNEIESVTNVFPQGIVDIYEITFQDGAQISACGNHLWKFHLTGKGEVNSKIGSTLDLKHYLDVCNRGSGKGRPIIPLCSPVDLHKKEYQDAPIPYTIGALLGDGYLGEANTSATITTEDKEILDNIESEGNKCTRTSSLTYLVNNGVTICKELGLWGKTSATKFIPDCYKYGSIDTRFSVIQGLMDTDGYTDVNGNCEYCSISKQLADDAEFILRSLGYTVTRTIKKAGYRKDGEYIECSECHVLYIRGKYLQNLFRLNRKRSRCKFKKVGNRVDSVVYTGKDYATCITITGEDKLFITDNFIVTHNSTCCLIKNLDSIHDPNFIGVIARETYPQLIRAGGLIHESKHIYQHFGGVYKSQEKVWMFPSGAQIRFNAIGGFDDTAQWQGSQICRLLIDEVAEWGEETVMFMFSRIRSTRYQGKCQLIATCNPSKDSFLYEWIKWCLDEDGIPKPGTENVIKWFVRIEGNMYWGDSKEELFKKYRHLVTRDDDLQPKSFRFIPMTIDDNPILNKKMPEYRANLLAQSRVNQLRYLKGSWTAVVDGEGYFKRDWLKEIDVAPRNIVKCVRAWDLAATVPSEVNRNPDWTVGVKMSRDKLGQYYIEDVVRFQKSANEVLEEIIKTAKADGISDVEVILPKDTGAGGKAAYAFYVRMLAEHGITVRGSQMSGHSGKLNRFLPFASLAESGGVSIVKGDWNGPYYTELENFIPGRRAQKDD